MMDSKYALPKFSFNFFKRFENGILGINARNLYYVSQNSFDDLKLVDNKLETKELLQENNIPTAKVYATISNRSELSKFDFSKLPSDFVIKPVKGFGGEGIIVIVKKEDDGFIDIKGNKYSLGDMKRHIIETLDGTFSLGGAKDTAFFEHRLILHSSFKPLVYSGIADIRVIVYRNIPVLAMTRLPTEESEGKANLHMGAVGAGIDIATGKTTTAAQHGKKILEIPHTGEKIEGFKIPMWDKVLEVSSKCQISSGLGYVGVDIVLDEKLGPLVLELNARPGLGIQIANDITLRDRLERVEELEINDPLEAVKTAKELFRN